MSRTADRPARRQQALEAAQHLLEDEGVGALSMRRLAKASNMAVNTLYAMFSTRDGILEALVQRAVQARLAHIESAVGDAASPVERLRRMVDASIQHAVAHPALTKPMYRAAAERRHLRRTATEVGLARIHATFDAAIQAGELRPDTDGRLLAEHQMLVVHETSLAWSLDEIDDEALAARCHHTLAVLLAAHATPACAPDMQARLAAATARLATGSTPH